MSPRYSCILFCIVNTVVADDLATQGWWPSDPAHQQPWYWPSHPGLFRFSAQEGLILNMSNLIFQEPLCPIYWRSTSRFATPSPKAWSAVSFSVAPWMTPLSPDQGNLDVIVGGLYWSHSVGFTDLKIDYICVVVIILSWIFFIYYGSYRQTLHSLEAQIDWHFQSSQKFA